jgi:hypothetical protein
MSHTLMEMGIWGNEEVRCLGVELRETASALGTKGHRPCAIVVYYST